MFLDAPNWADIKSADNSTPSMVAAWVAAIATGFAALAAIVAARWAKQAAAAAQRQVRLLQDQIDRSEPFPMITLELSHRVNKEKTRFQMVNVGDSPAFEVTISPLMMSGVSDGKKETLSLFFDKIRVLKKSDAYEVALTREAMLKRPLFKELTDEFIISGMLDAAAAPVLTDEHKPANNHLLGSIKVEYINVLSTKFGQSFDIILDGWAIFCRPRSSLVSNHAKLRSRTDSQ